MSSSASTPSPLKRKLSLSDDATHPISSKRSRSSSDAVAAQFKRHTMPNNSWIKTYRVIPDEIQVNKEIFKSLVDLKPTERGKAVMYGKELDVPRWQKLYGPEYRFGGKTHKGQSEIDHPYIQKLLEWVRDDSGLPYTQIIINWYMTGKEYIGAHSDNEAPIVPNSPIYSFSFGATRDFVIKGKKSNYRNVIHMYNNSLIIMGGEMQQHYKHEVPKRLKIQDPRINITFRVFK